MSNSIRVRKPILYGYYQKHGDIKTARRICSEQIQFICGMSLDDLSDTSEIADILWRIAEGLNADDLQSVRDAVSEIDYEFIQSLIYN